MLRTAATACLWIGVVGACHLGAAEGKDSADPILARLEAAKAEHAKAIDEARTRLMAAVDARLKTLTGKGDLKAVESVTEIRKSLEDDGQLPDGVTDPFVRNAVTTRDRAAGLANTKLQRAFEEAIRDYTKASKLDEAKAVQAEFESFLELSVKLPPAAIIPGPARLENGIYHIGGTDESRLRTKRSYSGPIEVTAVVQTKGTSVRLYAYSDARLVVNWEKNGNQLIVELPGGGGAQFPQ